MGARLINNPRRTNIGHVEDFPVLHMRWLRKSAMFSEGQRTEGHCLYPGASNAITIIVDLRSEHDLTACTAKDNRTRRLNRYPDTKSNGQVCKSLNQLKYLICSSSRAENSQFRAAKTKDSDPVRVQARCKSRLRASLGI